MSVVETINKAIRQKGQPETISDLLLTGLNMKSITADVGKVSEKCVKVEILELSSCKLESLKGLPVMPALTCLDLADNRLTDKDMKLLGEIKNLSQLYLEKNKVQKVQSLEPLKNLQFLERLQLGDNPITQTADYRQKVLEMLPMLSVLDKQSCKKNQSDHQELQEDDREDSYDNDQDEDHNSGQRMSQQAEQEEQEQEQEQERPKKRRRG